MLTNGILSLGMQIYIYIFISTFAKSGDAAFFVDSESICRFLGSSLFGKDRVPLKGAVQQKMRG